MTRRRMRGSVALLLFFFPGLGLLSVPRKSQGLVKKVFPRSSASQRQIKTPRTLKVIRKSAFCPRQSKHRSKAPSIQDVFTRADSENAIGKTIGMIIMAAPIGWRRSSFSSARKSTRSHSISRRRRWDCNGAISRAVGQLRADQNGASSINKSRGPYGRASAVPVPPAIAPNKEENLR